MRTANNILVRLVTGCCACTQPPLVCVEYCVLLSPVLVFIGEQVSCQPVGCNPSQEGVLLCLNVALQLTYKQL